MPCNSAPSQEEIEFNEQWRTNPIFRREIERLRKINDAQQLRYNEIIGKLVKKESVSELENTAFNSFMTVFLCKAMDLVKISNQMQYTYHDMEWWYDEHKRRDKGIVDPNIEE